MGPTEALVALAEVRELSPHVDVLECTDRLVLVAIDLPHKEGQRVRYRRLDVGTKVRGAPNHLRTSGIVPRPFRDDATYTLGEPAPASIKTKTPPKRRLAIQGAPQRRQAYAEILEKVAASRSRHRGLAAFARFLRRPTKPPAWLRKLMEDTSPLFVPFWRGSPLFDAVAQDFERGLWSPDGSASSSPSGHMIEDVVTGEQTSLCTFSAPGISRFGDAKAGGLLSVNEPTTARHGVVGVAVKRLRAPMGERTIGLHAKGMQWLVDEGFHVLVDRGSGDDGRMKVFFWTRSGRPGVDELMRDVLGRGLELSEVERRAEALAGRADDLCVLGTREGRRSQYVLWHYLPADEALQNLLAYARARHRSDGSVLSLNDIRRARIPFHRALNDDNSAVDFHKLDDLAATRCDPGVLLSVIDHVVDARPFPISLVHAVRLVYGTQQETNLRGGNLHCQTQEQVLH